jgi:hypothetical protein
MIDRLTAICLTGSVCFAALLWMEFRSDVAEPVAPPPPITKSSDNLTEHNDGPAIKQLVATTLSRPLFSATRRPPETVSDEHTDTPLNDLRLTGILIMPDQHVAIFARSGSKPLVRSEGEMISDWHIDSIATQAVSLSGPTGTTTLEPKADPSLTRAQSSAGPPTVPVPQPNTASATPPAVHPPNAPVRPAPVRRSER